MPVISRDLNIIARCGLRFRSAKLELFGLSATQAPYILLLCNNPGISQEQAAKSLYVNCSNATRQLAVLEANGFITRSASEKDKRIIEVFPTEKAKAVSSEVKRVNKEWNDYLTEGMTESEIGQLESLLDRIREKAASYSYGEDGR